jgi:hypothetical protein
VYILGLNLNLTDSEPEEYNCFRDQAFVARLYARHGSFFAYMKNEKIYDSAIDGRNTLESYERQSELTKAVIAIIKKLNEVKNAPITSLSVPVSDGMH